MIQVVVPYARLWPETRAALEADGIDARYVFTGGSDDAYYGLLRELWESGEGWLNVEQDIVPWSGAAAQLDACPRDWCACPYELSTGPGAWLGFTKFTAAFTRARPGAVAAIDGLPFDGTPRRHWGRLDTRLVQVLEDERLAPHIHYPLVGHLNPAQRFLGTYNYGCGHEVPRSVWTSRPWPYGRACRACKQRS